jgi:hypothetical protein
MVVVGRPGKVGTLQYLVWLLPLGLLAALACDDRVALVLLLATLTAAQLVFPLSSAAAESMRSWPYAIVLTRNLLLLAWAARAFTREILQSLRPVVRPQAAPP